MPLTELSPELADAADVLSDQLRVHLQRLAESLSPHADALDRRFLARLKKLHFRYIEILSGEWLFAPGNAVMKSHPQDQRNMDV